MREQVIKALDGLGLWDYARATRSFGRMVKSGTLLDELSAARTVHEPTDLPPGWLLYLTQANFSRRNYHESGKESIDYIQGLLGELDISPSSVVDILDFGCGAGRIMRWWDASKSVYGCDYNPKLVTWCQDHIPAAKVSLNKLSPPTTFADNSFDLLYSQSVLTHLPPELQVEWMEEWTRVVRPGGLILATAHGPIHLFNDKAKYEPQLLADGNLTLTSEKPGENLCAAFNTEEDMVGRVGRGLDLVTYREYAMPASRQNVFLFRVPASSPVTA